MALQKDNESMYGVTGNYHRITGIDISPRDGGAMVVVSLFKDKSARDAGKKELEKYQFLLKGSKFQSIASKLTEGKSIWEELATALYVYLKTLPEYTEATDV